MKPNWLALAARLMKVTKAERIDIYGKESEGGLTIRPNKKGGITVGTAGNRIPEPETRTLWQAKLKLVGDRKADILFRSTEDFQEASKTAQRLLESSSGAYLTGAVIVAVERESHLWN